MQVASLLILGAAKLDGVISAEHVGSAVHLLGSPQVIDAQLKGLADKNKTRFTKEQADSML